MELAEDTKKALERDKSVGGKILGLFKEEDFSYEEIIRTFCLLLVTVETMAIRDGVSVEAITYMVDSEISNIRKVRDNL